MSYPVTVRTVVSRVRYCSQYYFFTIIIRTHDVVKKKYNPPFLHTILGPDYYYMYPRSKASRLPGYILTGTVLGGCDIGKFYTLVKFTPFYPGKTRLSILEAIRLPGCIIQDIIFYVIFRRVWYWGVVMYVKYTRW